MGTKGLASRRGSVLILALWSLSILTAFAVSLGYMVRQKVTLLDRIEKRQRLWNAAWSGVEQARASLKADADTQVDSYLESWAHDPASFKGAELEGIKFFVGYERVVGKKIVTWSGLSDEQSKLNLNFSDPQAVSLLLQQVTSLNASSADPIAYAIVDWRDGDSAYGHPEFGAEDSDYDDLPKPYNCKDAPYESLDELLLVKGMNRDIFEKVKPYMTVFGSGAINLNTASREVLVSLGLPMTAADKLIRHRDGFDGQAATGDDRPFGAPENVLPDMARNELPPSDVERLAIENLIGSGKVGVASGVFGAVSRAESQDGRAELVIETVFNRGMDILYYRSTGLRWRSL